MSRKASSTKGGSSSTAQRAPRHHDQDGSTAMPAHGQGIVTVTSRRSIVGLTVALFVALLLYFVLGGFGNGLGTVPYFHQPSPIIRQEDSVGGSKKGGDEGDTIVMGGNLKTPDSKHRGVNVGNDGSGGSSSSGHISSGKKADGGLNKTPGGFTNDTEQSTTNEEFSRDSSPFLPLAWPPPQVWAGDVPAPFVRADDELEPFIPLSDLEWDHSDVRLSRKAPEFIGGTQGHAEGTSTNVASAIKVHYGVLATASLLYSRTIPLLNTSLRFADRVDVFLRKTALSYAIVKHLREFADRFMPNPSAMRVIELDGPDNKTLHSPHSIRNAWMAVDLMRFWGAEVRAASTESEGNVVGGLPPSVAAAHDPSLSWYCIVDDDGFVYTSNAKAMLVAEQIKFLQNTAAEGTSKSETPLLIGSTHLYRKKKLRRPFVVGGPGIFFNHAALMKATVPSEMEHCLKRHLYGGGDIRTSFCLMDAGARLVHIDHPYFDSPMRAVGEVKKQTISPYPVSFHRMRERMWAYRLAALDSLRRRARNGQTSEVAPPSSSSLVTWGDIEENFKPDNRLFFPSQFYPRQYDNFTWVYFRMTKESLAQYNKKRKRPLDADPL